MSLRWTQEALGKRSGKRSGLRRTEINRIEKGVNKGSSHAVRQALAKGFEMTADHLDAFLDGDIELKDARGHVGETRMVIVGPANDEHAAVKMAVGKAPRRRFEATPAAPQAPVFLSEPDPGAVERAIARLGPLLWPDAIARLREIAVVEEQPRNELGWVMVAADVQRDLEQSRQPPPVPPAPPRATPKPRKAS